MEGKHDASIQEAINRALEAERAATESVAECARAAEAVLQAAHAQARQVQQRAVQRVAALHERHGQQREKQIAAHLEEGMRPRPPLDPRLEDERIRRAVARLSARLSGGEA